MSSTPSALYRYRSLSADCRRQSEEVLRDEIDLLAQGFIWVSTPDKLNDPFDCRPIHSKEQGEDLKKILSHFWVGSFSALPPDHINASPMWSYYAGNHTGICIEFPFGETLRRKIPIEKVRYNNERFDIRSRNPARMRITAPVRPGVGIDIDEINDPENNIDILEFTRKSCAWAHEEEWRFIWRKDPYCSVDYEREMIAQYGPKHEHKVLISQPSRVICGADMDIRVKESIWQQLRSTGIQLVEAKLSPSECRVDIKYQQ